jgi:hypothetical protein
MRLTTFILSSGIALTWIPACASAQSIPPGMWVPHTAPRTRATKSARATRCQSRKQAGQLLGNVLMGASGGLSARGCSAEGRSLGQ